MSKIFDYLSPAHDHPVIDGLEDHERIIALEQTDKYDPLRTLPGENGASRIYRVELTNEQRKMITDGADILIEIVGIPMAPSRVMIVNDSYSNDDPHFKEVFAKWFASQTKGPYRIAL